MRSSNRMGTDFSFGGDKEDRTPDLLHAMQALSQLSYAPKRLLKYTSKTGPCQRLFYFFTKLVHPFSWVIFPSFISRPRARLKAALEMPKASLMISGGVASL